MARILPSAPNPEQVKNLEPRARTPTHAKQIWKFRLRPDDDHEPQDWWFASTAIPLLAATTGPLANVMSIAAIITPWRNRYDPAYPGQDAESIGFEDPRWSIGLNAASLACGVAGNIFLLLNFTRRVRYIIALPLTIIFWYFATGILMGITLSMNNYSPPNQPDETYSQGFWHAVIASVLYLASSMLLMVNMQGYFLGHYPQHFELTDEQRNLILQSMMFFIWPAGDGGIFARVCGWSYVDALYFCDVTILTVGFGNFHPPNDVGRGLVFPYSVGGIIILGLMVSSIRKFAQDLGHDNIIKNHVEKRRVNTIKHAVTTSSELEQRQKRKNRVASRKPKILLLREEKDRFMAMRNIQKNASNFKKYCALTMSVTAFGLLWCVGAIGFWKAEAKTQGLTYFQALYLCYVSLLTIGYGDFSPTSNAGKPFFIVWSLVAVPTMTILVSDLGDTVIASFKRGTFTLADWTVLPKAGLYRAFIDQQPWLYRWLRDRAEVKAEKERVAEGFSKTLDDEAGMLRQPRTLEEIAAQDDLDEHMLARTLAIAIRRTANDLKADIPRRYTYEEWVEFTRLIRFTRKSKDELAEEEEEGLVDWDWIGEKSPMMAEQSESEWVLDRLCESLDRYMMNQQRSSGAG